MDHSGSLMESSRMPEIEPQSTMCKASALPAALYLLSSEAPILGLFRLEATQVNMQFRALACKASALVS